MFIFLTVFKSANGTLERGTPTGKLKKKKKETKKKYEVFENKKANSQC